MCINSVLYFFVSNKEKKSFILHMPFFCLLCSFLLLVKMNKVSTRCSGHANILQSKRNPAECYLPVNC